jgi:hypothetical protein
LFVFSFFFAVTVAFLPSILQLGTLWENQVFIDTLKSHIFGYVLVLNIGIAIPYFADFIFEIRLKMYNGDINYKLLAPPKLFLLFSFIIPNLFMLLYAIPHLDVDLFLSLILLRWILIVYGFAYHIWLTGGPYFQTKWFILGNFLLFTGFTLGTLDLYACFPKYLLFWIAVGASFIANTILLVIYINWIKSLKKIGFKNLSLSQRNCFWHTIIFAVFCLIFFIIATSHTGNYDDTYVVQISCVEGMMTLGLIISDSQLSKLLEASMKEVNKINSIIYSTYSCFNIYFIKELLEMKRNLIRFLSHEIRTPLNAVNMGLMIIKRELQDHEDGKDIDCRDILSVVEEVENASITSLDILNDLLTYEKIDAGILILEKETVTAYTIVHECLRPFLLQVYNQ